MEEVFDYQIRSLTAAFYRDHPNETFPEILTKQNRPYNCLLLRLHEGYLICVPFRSQITHRYAFMFRASRRSRRSRSGLDYSKIVIVRDKGYISEKDAIVDADEYAEARRNIDKIRKGAMDYVYTYTKCLNGEEVISATEFHRRYDYSTLKYFHRELGIADDPSLDGVYSKK